MSSKDNSQRKKKLTKQMLTDQAKTTGQAEKIAKANDNQPGKDDW